jgi:phosphatidylserine/phosphatidylglycerophosphate/cardiolipin synthase-like enzyme
MVQEFEQSGILDFSQQAADRLTKYLLDKKATPKLCLEVMKSLMSRLQHKPIYHQSMFFPSSQNVKDLAQVIRRAEKKVDACVFAFTNDILAEALAFVFAKGVPVRIIVDDECAKFNGADVWRLGMLGVPCTTDNNKMAHMHNKYCLIDNQILITGSFNWTS